MAVAPRRRRRGSRLRTGTAFRLLLPAKTAASAPPRRGAKARLYAGPAKPRSDSIERRADQSSGASMAARSSPPTAPEKSSSAYRAVAPDELGDQRPDQRADRQPHAVVETARVAGDPARRVAHPHRRRLADDRAGIHVHGHPVHGPAAPGIAALGDLLVGRRPGPDPLRQIRGMEIVDPATRRLDDRGVEDLPADADHDRVGSPVGDQRAKAGRLELTGEDRDALGQRRLDGLGLHQRRARPGSSISRRACAGRYGRRR